MDIGRLCVLCITCSLILVKIDSFLPFQGILFFLYESKSEYVWSLCLFLQNTNSPSESDRHLAGQDIPRVLWNLQFIVMSTVLHWALTRSFCIKLLSHYIFKNVLILSLRVRLNLQNQFSQKLQIFVDEIIFVLEIFHIKCCILLN